MEHTHHLDLGLGLGTWSPTVCSAPIGTGESFVASVADKKIQPLPHCGKESWGPDLWQVLSLSYIGAFFIKPPHCLQKSLGDQLKGSVWARNGYVRGLNLESSPSGGPVRIGPFA